MPLVRLSRWFHANFISLHFIAKVKLKNLHLLALGNIMNLNKSLEELEGDVWVEPVINSTLAAECHRLRKAPLSSLSPENLRILIGQKIGLIFLVPLALNILEANPLVSGNLYKGDLLANVAAIPEEFWSAHPELNNRLVEIAHEVGILSETIKGELVPVLAGFSYK
jgi:hypothetical protein